MFSLKQIMNNRYDAIVFGRCLFPVFLWQGNINSINT